MINLVGLYAKKLKVINDLTLICSDGSEVFILQNKKKIKG